ncbi:hypothetical protein AGMMS50230_22590 [Spirochaetia bacterium]|nr:hypothetical protein AGMMS50230_22590 [Spirochaetia bacterium]
MPEEKRTKAVGRLRFSVGQAAIAAQRIAYVRRSTPVPHFLFYLL